MSGNGGLPRLFRVSAPDSRGDTALDWQQDAACLDVDPDMFFPVSGDRVAAAKKICAGCEVRSQCLEYAIANDERFGIWGGLSEGQRAKLRRQDKGPVPHGTKDGFARGCRTPERCPRNARGLSCSDAHRKSLLMKEQYQARKAVSSYE